MIKFTKLFALSALTISLLAAGCSDDATVTPPATKGSNPVATGNTHTYRGVQLDSGNVENSASSYTEARVISGASMTHMGQANAFMEVTSVAGIPVDTMYVSNEGNTSMRYMEPVSFNGLSSVIIPARWVKVADFAAATNTEWTTLDTTMANVPVSLGGQNTTADVTIKQTRKKTGTKSIMYGSTPKTVTATEFTSTNNFSGTVVTPFGALPVNFNVVEMMYFVENVGMVKNRRDYMVIDLVGLQQPLPGFDITLQSEVIK